MPGDAFAGASRYRGHGLDRLQSTESQGDNPKPPKKEKKVKAPNFAAKGHSKLKEARAMDTDAKMWTRKIEAEKKKGEDAKLLLVLFDSYLSNSLITLNPTP